MPYNDVKFRKAYQTLLLTKEENTKFKVHLCLVNDTLNFQLKIIAKTKKKKKK